MVTIQWLLHGSGLRMVAFHVVSQKPTVQRFFKVKDKGAMVIEGVDYSPLEAKIKEAAEMCPVEVIKYEEN